MQTCFAASDIIFYSYIMFGATNKTGKKEEEIAKSSRQRLRTPARQITGDDTYHLISANKNLITAIMA